MSRGRRWPGRGSRPVSRLLGPGLSKRLERPLSPGRRPSTTNGARACRAWRIYFRPESNPEMRRPGIPAGFDDRKQITETAAANLMCPESARVTDKLQVYCIKVSPAGTSFLDLPLIRFLPEKLVPLSSSASDERSRPTERLATAIVGKNGPTRQFLPCGE